MLVNVKYDLMFDGETLSMLEAGVGPIMEVPDDLDVDVSTFISDKTGWCVWEWREVSYEEAVQVLFKEVTTIKLGENYLDYIERMKKVGYSFVGIKSSKDGESYLDFIRADLVSPQQEAL